MIFEERELETISKALENSDSLVCSMIKLKLDEIRSQSLNKRYSLRTTDWLVENGKKSKKRGRK